jgi:hypothetical protein
MDASIAGAINELQAGVDKVVLYTWRIRRRCYRNCHRR